VWKRTGRKLLYKNRLFMIINAYSDCMPFRNGRGIVLIFWMIVELVLGYF